MFNTKTIRKHVLAKIEEKIAEHQATFEARVAEIEAEAEAKKSTAFETAVGAILSKLL